MAARSVRFGRRASAAMRREYAIVFCLACLSEIAVRTLSLKRAAALLRVDLHSAQELQEPLEDLPAWAVDRYRVVNHLMRNWPVDGVCLRQSLVLGNRLRALRPVLKIGVARDDQVVKAHAWLEVSGRSLDTTSHQFSELPIPA